MPDEAFEVVGEIGHADLDPRALDADGANEQAHAMLLRGEDMLDRRAHFRTGGVGPLAAGVHRLALGLTEMDHRFELALADGALILQSHLLNQIIRSNARGF